ncbi:MAG TPA: hypothetical protein VK841_22520 [Polyangiaceae bacterium]|nr:hypothetical protein [Polyangiaceae bacterium]
MNSDSTTNERGADAHVTAHPLREVAVEIDESARSLGKWLNKAMLAIDDVEYKDGAVTARDLARVASAITAARGELKNGMRKAIPRLLDATACGSHLGAPSTPPAPGDGKTIEFATAAAKIRARRRAERSDGLADEKCEACGSTMKILYVSQDLEHELAECLGCGKQYGK